MSNFHKERRRKRRIKKLNTTNDGDDFTGNISLFIHFSRIFVDKFHLNFRNTYCIIA
jgi:hypothetical protein